MKRTRLVRRVGLRRGKPLRKVSRKKAKAQRELDALKPALIERSSGYCEARFSKYCTGVGTVPHHMLKQSQARHRHEFTEILWVCSFCNDDIELRPAEAHFAGLVILSHERGPHGVIDALLRRQAWRRRSAA